MNEELEKESLIMMQLEKNGSELAGLETICCVLEERLKNILLPTNLMNETSEKLPAEVESEMKKELKRHRGKVQDIRLIISNILDRLEL